MSVEESMVELERIEKEGLSTIIADGKGGIVPFISMGPEIAGGLSQTAVVLIRQGKVLHENVHIADALSTTPDIAVGLEHGQLIHPNNVLLLHSTEVRGYLAEFEFLKGVLHSPQVFHYSSELSNRDITTMNNRMIKVGRMGNSHWTHLQNLRKGGG